MKAFEDSRDLAVLEDSFAPLAVRLLTACAARGAKMTPFFTLRGPGVQAKLWCQSRSAEQIERQAEKLRAAGAPWLAGMLRRDFAAAGPPVTNALPGLSWHQWGEAIDCFPMGANGQAIWNPKHASYRVYAGEAKKLGLEAGGFWKRFPDAVHVQLRSAASPLAAGFTWPQIEAAMRRRFPD